MRGRSGPQELTGDLATTPSPGALEIAYRVLGTIIGWGQLFVGCALWALGVIPVTLVLSIVWPGARTVFRKLTCAALRYYFSAQISMRVDIERGTPTRGPHIVVANHQSWFDPLILLAWDPTLVGPSRGYILNAPVMGWIARILGFTRAESGHAGSFDEITAQADRAADAGQTLLFFPEGTRTRDGSVGPFERGAFRLAVEQQIPVQPVVVEGLDAVLPAGKLWAQGPWRYRVRVRYLAPITPPPATDSGRREVRGFARRVHGVIAAELEALRDERR